MKKSLSFLFVTIEGGGNIPVVLGLATRLAQRGHRVRVLTEPCLQETVESYGLLFIPFTKCFTKSNRTEDIFKDSKASPLKNPSFDNVVFGPVDLVAEETYFALQSEQTDILVADVLLPATLIPGEALGIKTVSLFHMPEYLPGGGRPPGGMGLTPGRGFLGSFRDRMLGRLFHRIMNKYLPKINKTRQNYGLGKLRNVADIYNKPALRLIQTSIHFDFPASPLPANVRYAGAVLDDPDWVKDWLNPWPQNDPRPLAVVSLSSTFQNQQETIQQCINALGQLNVRGLVTAGPAMSREEFTVPQNVVVIPNGSHAQIFPFADIVITHAGHGTVMRALGHGVPLLCLPMGRDQDDNAAKVAYRKAGIRLGKNAGAAKIKNAVSAILGDKSFKDNAERLRQLIREEAGKNMAVSYLESLIETTDGKL